MIHSRRYEGGSGCSVRNQFQCPGFQSAGSRLSSLSVGGYDCAANRARDSTCARCRSAHAVAISTCFGVRMGWLFILRWLAANRLVGVRGFPSRTHPSHA